MLTGIVVIGILKLEVWVIIWEHILQLSSIIIYELKPCHIGVMMLLKPLIIYRSLIQINLFSFTELIALSSSNCKRSFIVLSLWGLYYQWGRRYIDDCWRKMPYLL